MYRYIIPRMSSEPGEPAMTHLGCLLVVLGLAGLAVALFGLHHSLYEMASAVPILPGLAIAVTHLAQAMLRSAAATVSTVSAGLLIAVGMFLMFQGQYRQR